MANDFNLGTIEFYLGLEATGKTVTIDNSASPIAEDATTIPVTGLDLADIKKDDKLYLLKVGSTDEYVLVKSESTGDLTVKRNWLKDKAGAPEIADGTVLTEYKFVKRKIAEDGVSISNETLVEPVRVISHDGVEEILFDTESEEPKVSVTLLDRQDWTYIQDQCPLVSETDNTDVDDKFIFTQSVDDYDVDTYNIPCMLAFKALSYNSYCKIYPKLTLLTLPTEDYSKGEVFTMSIEFSAIKKEVPKADGSLEKVYSWEVVKKP